MASVPPLEKPHCAAKAESDPAQDSGPQAAAERPAAERVAPENAAHDVEEPGPASQPGVYSPPMTKPASRPGAPEAAQQTEAAQRTEAAQQPEEPDDDQDDETPASSEAETPEETTRQGHGLNAAVGMLPGVGSVQSRRLNRLGIMTIEDLLYLFPRRYDDYSHLKTISQLVPGEDVTIIVNVRSTTLRRINDNRSLIKCRVSDGTGYMDLTWFNQPYLEKQLPEGRQIVVSGRVDQYLGRPTMNAPEWEPLDKDQAREQVHTNRLVPVYPLTEGISNRWLRRLMKQTLDHWAPRMADHLSADVRSRHHLTGLGDALLEIHFPESLESLDAARRRLIFDEFLLLQLGILRQRQAWRSQAGKALRIDRPAIDQFVGSLPYALTGAQGRVIDEILADITTTTPMNRLLQGDVGSGKTVVAAAAAVAVMRAGGQMALMAPTEILAEQHCASFGALLKDVRVVTPEGERAVAVRLLTGSTPAAERRAIIGELADGSADVVIGTHALIQEGVTFSNLALAIIDEQHRFGVAQRAALREKGYNPHLLVMTATPIPRTLSLTLFGDLDISVIDELPAGRQPIQTYIVTNRERERAYRFVQKQVQEGHQAYIICPLVEESESVDARAVVAEHERLQRDVFPTLRLGLLHGRMKGDEKDQVMRQFDAGELDILVSTSVVEVGIDVPNATVMLIEDAERFGLSQLHQFRGRVGRGPAPSYCLLVTQKSGEEGWERLTAVAESQDGFALAEKDLQMRGPGDFFGTRQSGLPTLRLAQLADLRVLETAREEARSMLDADPSLAQPAHATLRERVDAVWSRVHSDPS
jgi:ATP-dependent DNA helicase RecG